MLSTEYKRHAQDDRIVVAGSLADVPKLDPAQNIHGILYPSAFSDEDVKAIALHLQERNDKFKSELVADGEKHTNIPQPLSDAFDTLKKIYKDATGRRKANAVLVSNPHQYFGQDTPSEEPLLTQTMKGAAIGINARGESYPIPAGHVFIFDEQVRQIVPPGQPALTIMVG